VSSPEDRLASIFESVDKDRAAELLRAMVENSGLDITAVAKAVGSRTALYNWFGGSATAPVRALVTLALYSQESRNTLLAEISGSIEVVEASRDRELRFYLSKILNVWNEPHKREEVRDGIRLGLKAAGVDLREEAATRT